MPDQNAAQTWRYEAATKTIRSVPENYWIASMNSWDGAVDHEINAHVIAAALDAYRALCQLLESHVKALANLGFTDEEIDRDAVVVASRAAIAKAEAGLS